MRFIKRILILAAAAWLGATVYVRFLAVENIVSTVQKSMAESSEKREHGGTGNHSNNTNRPVGYNRFKGGIGPVGNPHNDGGGAYR
jgi:hypothetical protein